MIGFLTHWRDTPRAESPSSLSCESTFWFVNRIPIEGFILDTPGGKPHMQVAGGVHISCACILVIDGISNRLRRLNLLVTVMLGFIDMHHIGSSRYA
jgi:hypothetical protein